jgi:ATP-dependent protease ClpP protease subunit
MEKFWKIKTQTTNSAELQLYGPISNDSWWGDEVTPQQFADDLKALGPISALDVHINSGGGDVFAGIAIYNMLKSHSATINVHVDGLAASIASVIAMAGDTINMPAGSMMMIHNPASGVLGYYEASELRKIADTLDSIKESIMDVYAGKCGKKKDEIATLMDEETWLTASEAVDLGFATETDTSISYEASLDKSCLIVNGVSFDMKDFKHMPKIANTQRKSSNKALPTHPQNKEESLMDLKELKEKHPDLYNSVYYEGVKAERKRMQTIDSLEMPGHKELIAKAKYETGESAETLAVNLVKAEMAARKQTLTDLEADVQDSLVNSVTPPAAPVDNKNEEAEIKEAASLIANAANRGRIK